MKPLITPNMDFDRNDHAQMPQSSLDLKMDVDAVSD